MTTVNLASLSRRELQVLLFTADGRTSVEIAGELKLANETVRFYLRRLRDKTGIRRKTLMAIWAASHRRELKRHQAAKEKHERKNPVRPLEAPAGVADHQGRDRVSKVRR